MDSPKITSFYFYEEFCGFLSLMHLNLFLFPQCKKNLSSIDDDDDDSLVLRFLSSFSIPTNRTNPQNLIFYYFNFGWCDKFETSIIICFNNAYLSLYYSFCRESQSTPIIEHRINFFNALFFFSLVRTFNHYNFLPLIVR